MPIPLTVGDAHEKFKTMLTHRYFIRVHYDANKRCPGAATVGQVFQTCVLRR